MNDRHRLLEPVAAWTRFIYPTYPVDAVAVEVGGAAESLPAGHRYEHVEADAVGTLHLNWDGEVDIGADPPIPLAGRPDHNDWYPLDQRRELLLHRCFVRGPLPPGADDRFPFNDRLSLTTAEWPLRPESIVHVPPIR